MKPSLLCILLAAFLSVVAAGCGRSPESADSTVETSTTASVQTASYRQGSPKELLAAVFARYRAAASYRDDGRAQISYRNGDVTETRAAPMRVWFDRNELYLSTYDVRLTSDPESLTAWIADPSSDNFDSQVIKAAPIRGRPTTPALLSDPILAGRVTAGLAGPPPQLEWLFSPDPMRQLFQGDHQFEFGSTRIIEARQCRCVTVDAEGQRFQFWIDDRASIIRRVDLPPIFAPLSPGMSPQPISLSIDLVGASFDAPDRAPKIEHLPQSPKLLTRFVPLPPPRPSRTLGTRVPGFSKSSNDDKLTMLLRVSGADDAESESIGQQWSEAVPEQLREQVRIRVLTDRDAEVAESLSLAPGGVALIDGDGVIVWIDDEASAATLSVMTNVMADVLSGVDVPERLRSQWSEQVAMYDRARRELAAPVN